MSRAGRIGRVLVSLAAIGLLAGVVSVGLSAVLVLAGVPNPRASPVATAVAVAVALAVADVYTPIGRGPSRSGLREREPTGLVADFALAGVVAGVVGAVLTLLGSAGVSVLGNSLVVLVVGVGAGYGSFMLRNRAYYLGGEAVPEEPPPDEK